MADRNQSSQKMPGFGRFGGARGRFKPTEKPKNAKGTLLRLLKIFMGWRKPLLVSTLLTVLSSFAALLTPWLLGRAVNTFRIGKNTVDEPLLATVLISLIFCYLISWVIDTVNGSLMARITQDLVKYIRTELFAKMQKLPLNFYDTSSHGDVMSRITNDVDNISSTIAQTTTQLLSSAFSIVGSIVMMLLLSPLLTLVAMISIPLFVLLTKVIAKRSRAYFLGQQRALGALNSAVEENIEGLKMVKAFNLQDRVISNFESVNARMKDYSIKAQIWSGLMMPFMNVINNLSYGLLACIGGVLSVQGTVTVGVVVSFLSYSKQFGQPLNSIAGMFNTIQSALAGAERIFEMLDENEEVPDKANAVGRFEPKGKIEFKDVSFSYATGKTVLNHISFSVKPGEVIALVGETGAGKTTIVNLLTRFYELNRGSIRIDGLDISDIRRDRLRDCFSIVLQDTCLFTGTIADNIRYSRPGASDEEVVAAARLARAHPFITRLPRQYQTVVSGGTDNLSQGQRQLLSIARAVLCDAPILIFDEATSSVDTKTEKEIQKAMMTLMKNRTSFFIAHRLSTIRDADRIIVVGGGMILESGTHAELMDQRGTYYKMVVSQLGNEDVAED
ncbi:MAG TPA: ABC transporter ATP-binding protein [Caproiciproducens sp.]|nr:ABC transporter ATP-binding protein [Caproiciproducens sp.]